MTSLEQDYGPLIDTLLGQAFFSDNKTFIICYKYSFIRNQEGRKERGHIYFIRHPSIQRTKDLAGKFIVQICVQLATCVPK